MIDAAAILEAAGMSGANARLCAAAWTRAFAAWRRLTRTRSSPRGLFVPGRIEVLGKHTDYAGGSSLTCAAERGLSAVYSRRSDSRVRVLDERLDKLCDGELDPALTVPARGWANYPLTAVRRVARDFAPPLAGVDLVFHSTLPVSAGLSSSSALITATVLALADVNELAARPAYATSVRGPVELAQYLGSVENGSAFGPFSGDRGVGTFGGSQDHTAILASVPDRIGHFAFCPGRQLASLPVPAGCSFVVAGSGVIAGKTGNAREAYNRAAALAAELLACWRHATGRTDATLAGALRSGPDAGQRLASLVAECGQPAWAQRLEHFRLENDVLVPHAARALLDGDIEALGSAAERSQAAAEALLGNQVPETAALARLARTLGAPAASAFGAGFGGSVWALVRAADADAFASAWLRAYRSAGGDRKTLDRAFTFVTGAGPPATVLC